MLLTHEYMKYLEHIIIDGEPVLYFNGKDTATKQEKEYLKKYNNQYLESYDEHFIYNYEDLD